jgi:CubicO group peptidase (beta-lactamase class C family)
MLNCSNTTHFLAEFPIFIKTSKHMLLYYLSFLPFTPVLLSRKRIRSSRISRTISRIENGLQPNLQVEGDSVPLFNIEERLRELGIPGVSIALLANGEIEWARAYGMADSSENRPMTIETMLLAGWISKPVCSLACASAHGMRSDQSGYRRQ